jgi:hypothetical protein
MRFARIAALVCFLILPGPARAQQATATTAQGLALLQQSAAALAGKATISDATLDGTAVRIAGSDEESGNVTLEALFSGQSLVKFVGGSGQYTEVVSISSGGGATGSWAGPDGVAHAVAEHNLHTDSSWFFPALTIGKVIASPATVATLVGPETKNGVSCTHITVYRQRPEVPAQLVAQLQGLTQMEMYLDPTTLLPVALDFAAHPDNNLLLNIPVEIRFSDYRSVNGVQVPFHVQKYLNNSLFLDVQLQIATVNSGLAASAFTIQ